MKNYYDVSPGPAPTWTATSQGAEGHRHREERRRPELKWADEGYPRRPTTRSWQTDLRSVAPVGIDGPQWVLEYWSDLNDVFQFVRVEDIAYDKRPGKGNVVYIVDSGGDGQRCQSQDTPNFRSTNGRVWKMVLDPDDPTKVTSLTVFVEGDDNPVQTPTEMHQPDNLETTQNGLLVTEDQGRASSSRVDSTDPKATTARLWHVPFARRAGGRRKVDQSADGPGPTDVDGRTPGNWGEWESSGIVDASRPSAPACS